MSREKLRVLCITMLVFTQLFIQDQQFASYPYDDVNLSVNFV